MKYLLILLLAVFTLSMTSCSETIIGPEGPRGATGAQGPAGEDAENAYVFEYENINFTAANNYEVVLEYPSNFEGYTSDIALVYLLWDVQEIDGQNVDIWRPLMQQVIFSDGLLQYNYDFTSQDVRLFLDATFPLDELGAIDTDEWVARIVIVPGDYWSTGRMTELPAYEDLASALDLPSLDKDHSGYVSRKN